MGGVALRAALRLAAGEKLDSHHVELATELIVRSSTAPPPPAGSGMQRGSAAEADVGSVPHQYRDQRRQSRRRANGARSPAASAEPRDAAERQD